MNKELKILNEQYCNGDISEKDFWIAVINLGTKIILEIDKENIPSKYRTDGKGN